MTASPFKMGAHGTLEDALANVQSFAAADASNERSIAKKDRKRGSKDDKKAFKKGSHKTEHRSGKKKASVVLRSHMLWTASCVPPCTLVSIKQVLGSVVFAPNSCPAACVAISLLTS